MFLFLVSLGSLLAGNVLESSTLSGGKRAHYFRVVRNTIFGNIRGRLLAYGIPKAYTSKSGPGS